MKKTAYLLIVLMAVMPGVVKAEEPVYFADATLKDCVEDALGISDPTPTNMLYLTWLFCNFKGITDLTGLEYATNLTQLLLGYNQISDISPLSGLTNLTGLHLGNNQISDISAVAGLTNLTILTLSDNQISDISALSGLTHLTRLWLNDNQISDISVLAGLTNLTYLNLQVNPLNEAAYCTHLPLILTNNPGIKHLRFRYDSNPNPPENVSASDGTYTDKVQITWNIVCSVTGDSYYHVYRSDFEGGTKTALGDWQTLTSYDDTTATAGTAYYYWVKAKTQDFAGKYGETGYSSYDTGWAGVIQRTLTISSTSGGSVTTPGEGTFQYDHGQEITLEAEAEAGYHFTNWSGSLFSTDNPVTITMDSDYHVKANFAITSIIIYVDDDSPNDPAPYDPAYSDPNENGTPEHPFDMIQEGIDAALDGETVIVRDGTYWEAIEFAGRNITVTGFEPNEPNAILPYPVIDANYIGTAVTFCNEEEPNCILEGFVITRGAGEVAGGINCVGSSPTISRCLIVGNCVMDPNGGGGAVFCIDSNAVFENCTFSGNYGGEQGAGLLICDSNVVLLNSIPWDNDREVSVVSGSLPVTAYCDVQGGWWGTGNMIEPPLFAEPGYWVRIDAPDVQAKPSDLNAIWIDGDYHLLSEHGRYWPEHDVWVFDKVTSPCIDAGDPNTSIGEEPFPNGDIINMGAYGGTAEASKSTTTTNAFLRFDLESDPGWAVEGDWQFGRPLGAGGANGNPDPNSGYTGTNVYGVNLAGDYRVAVGGPYYLTAGPFNCSGYQQISLRFVRWLNSDFYPYVANTLEVSNDGQTWQVIWESQDGQKLADSEWQVVDYDISAVADGQPAVYVRWSYEIVSERAFDYSGWNIDDIELRAVP